MTAIFISHSSADNAAAAEMKAWLEAQGHTSLFLDFNGFPPQLLELFSVSSPSSFRDCSFLSRVNKSEPAPASGLVLLPAVVTFWFMFRSNAGFFVLSKSPL